MAEIDGDPEAFFQLTVKTASSSSAAAAAVSSTATVASNNNEMSLEDFEGYVTLFAVVPTNYLGMAMFYYDMLEHIATIYPFTVRFILLPWQSKVVVTEEDPSKEQETTIVDAVFQPQRYQNPKVVLLEPSSRPTKALEYLLHAPIVAGNGEDVALQEDRVTIFLVSADGMFIERLVSPTITLLERRLAVFLLQLSLSPEL